MYICCYCCKECKNLNSLRQHEIRCKSNPNKLDLSYIKAGRTSGHKGGNQYTKAKELGIDAPVLSDDTRYKLGNSWRGKSRPQEDKDKISKGIRRAILKNPESYSGMNVNGRVKHYNYNGIKLDGLWELEVAKYLDKNGIEWKRPNTGFKYIWNNKEHLYFPDFYLPKYNYYIEVKGFQRDRDLCKWQAVKNLIVIKKEEIDKIRSDHYDLGL